jgi:hypothetical protein
LFVNKQSGQRRWRHASVDPHGLSTVFVAMLRGVALQRVLDDQVDLASARHEVEQLLTARLGVRLA